MVIETFVQDGDLVVYPSHGVGKVTAIEKQEVAGCELQVFVINFAKNRMTLRLPMQKAKNAGLRSLSSATEVSSALSMLKKRVPVKKGIWARRAQEYEAKISSGSLNSIAEVLRELFRAEGQQSQSYSERQIYQTALERMTTEIAAIENIEESQAVSRVEEMLLAA